MAGEVVAVYLFIEVTRNGTESTTLFEWIVGGKKSRQRIEQPLRITNK